jgi:divinyl chlorophyllide a 8-vinyl-reductase
VEDRPDWEPRSAPPMNDRATDALQTGRCRRVFLVGATGTIGAATARALVDRGHDVVCFIRPLPGLTKEPAREAHCGATRRG